MAGELFLLYCTAIVAKNILHNHLALHAKGNMSNSSWLNSQLHPAPFLPRTTSWKGCLGCIAHSYMLKAPAKGDSLRPGAMQGSFSHQVIKVPQPEGGRGNDYFCTEKLPVPLHAQRGKKSQLFLGNTLESSQTTSVKLVKVN